MLCGRSFRAMSRDLEILFRDAHLVAVHKPSGLLVHRDELHPEEPAALQIVRDMVGHYVYPVQRLDRGTSGILIYALQPETATALQASWQLPDACKEYLALVRWPGANPELGECWINERPLHDHRDVARAARTEFALVEVLYRSALVSARLRTGRFHQIRRHLNHDGRHVFGDTSHGKGRNNALYRERYGLDRLFLHMHRLAFAHPVGGARVEITDPLPAELVAVVAALRAERDAPS